MYRPDDEVCPITTYILTRLNLYFFLVYRSTLKIMYQTKYKISGSIYTTVTVTDLAFEKGGGGL